MAGITVPVNSPNTYANNEDLANYWQAQTDTTRTNYILKMVSNRLRLVASQRGIDLDAKVNADPVYFLNVQSVVMEGAKRALQAPLDQQPTETYGLTAGPYSENFKFSNPNGDIFFRKSELELLGLEGKQTLRGITTSIRDIYSPYESS